MAVFKWNNGVVTRMEVHHALVRQNAFLGAIIRFER